MKDLDYPAVLRDFTYKPNFGYGAYERDGGWWIKIVMWVENARKPMEKWEIGQRQTRLSPFDDYDVERYYRFDDRYLPPTPQYYSPSREVIEVVGNWPIPYFGPGDEFVFIQWLVRTLKHMEEHETDEWARYKGELLNDPHKET